MSSSSTTSSSSSKPDKIKSSRLANAKKSVASKVLSTRMGRKEVLKFLGSQGTALIEALESCFVKHCGKKVGEQHKTNLMKLAAKGKILYDAKSIPQDEASALFNPILLLAFLTLDYLQPSSRMRMLSKDLLEELLSQLQAVYGQMITLLQRLMSDKNCEKATELYIVLRNPEFLRKLRNDEAFATEKGIIKANIEAILNLVPEDQILAEQRAPCARPGCTHRKVPAEQKGSGVQSGGVAAAADSSPSPLDGEATRESSSEASVTTTGEAKSAPSRVPFRGSEFCQKHHYTTYTLNLLKPSFDSWLREDVLRNAMREWFLNQGLGPSIDFLSAVESYKSISNKSTRYNRANKLCAKFLEAEEGSSQIAVSSVKQETLDEVKKSLMVKKGSASSQLFADAVNEVTAALREAFSVGYLTSPDFQSFRETVLLPPSVLKVVEAEYKAAREASLALKKRHSEMASDLEKE